MKRLFFAALTGTAIPAFWLSRRYRHDMNAARARLAAVERHVIATPWGAVEYAERGSGNPVLVVHGIFHNCVGDSFPSATFRTVDSSPRLDSVISARACRSTRHRPIKPTRSPLC